MSEKISFPELALPPGLVLDAHVAEYVYMAACYSTSIPVWEEVQYQEWLKTLRFPCFVKAVNTQNQQSGFYHPAADSFPRDWSPSTNPQQALRVVDKMASIGLWFDCHSPWRPGENWVGGFTPHGTTGFNDRPDSQCLGESFALVVCLSALRWMLECSKVEENP